jgi:charged multivesicular body protein 2A
MPLEWLFGKRMTPEEMLRRNQRALNKAMRDLDRERARMEQQEKKIIADIKKMAKEGQMVCIHMYCMKLFIKGKAVVSYRTYLQWSETRGLFILFGL